MFMMNYGNVLQPPFIEPQPKRHLRIGISEWSRMAPECLLVSSTIHCDPGFELGIIQILMTALNFTVELKYSTQPGCGYVDENGKFNGLLGMLQRNEVDFIGNLCTVDEYRSNVSWLVHSWPVVLQKQAFLIKAPVLGVSFKLFAPFTIPVWFILSMVTIIFLILFALFYKLFGVQTFMWAFMKAVDDLCNITIGLDCILQRHTWFQFICFVGYVQLLYSTFVTIVVLRPSDVETPFGSHIQLADAVYNGEYKILDYQNNPFVRCYCSYVCKRLEAAYNLHQYHHYNRSNTEESTNDMLQLLIDHPNLVLVKNRHTLSTYLDEFPGRAKLWLIDDEAAGVEWFSYFFRKDFELAYMFNKVLMLMSDNKDNLNHRYNYLSYQAIQTKKIVGHVSEHTKFSIEMLRDHFFYFMVTIVVSCIFFLMEIVYYKNQHHLIYFSTKNSMKCFKNVEEPRQDTLLLNQGVKQILKDTVI